MNKIIINHKWQCPICKTWIGEDYDECSICQDKKINKNEKYQIKNECVSCGREFKNNEKRFKERGNFCPDCCSKCEAKLQWRKTKKAKEYLEELLLKTELTNEEIIKIQNKIKKKEEELKELTQRIKEKWGIYMEEDDKKFQILNNYLLKQFKVKD